MKKLLVALLLSLALGVAPIEAAREAADQKHKKSATKKKHEKKKDKKKGKKGKRSDKKHQKISEKRSTGVERSNKSWLSGKSMTGVSGGDKAVGTMNSSGKTVYEGPREGHYYITSTGTKEYVDDSEWTRY